VSNIIQGNYNYPTDRQNDQMANIREILAQNLKENRRKLGFTQPMLAEKVGLSTHYLGMIEIGRNFPSADALERLAEALEINVNELFYVAVSPEKAIEDLQQAAVKNIEKAVSDAVEKVLGEVYKGG